MLRKLSVGARLAALFGVVVVLFLAVGGVSLYTGAQLKEADALKDHTFEVLGHVEEMSASMVDMETGVRGYLLSGNEANLAPWVDGQKHFGGSWAALHTLTADNPAQLARLNEVRDTHEAFTGIAKELIGVRQAIVTGSATMDQLVRQFALGKDKAAMDRFRSLAAELQDAERNLLGQRAKASDDLRMLNRMTTLVGSGLALVCAVAAWLWVTRSITRPILQAVQVAEAVAAGDLTVRVDVNQHDETGRLLKALSAMTGRLSELVGQVRTASESIATGATEIAGGNIDLSQRTEQQASSLQETAASMEQLNATVKSNADTARAATQLAGQASTAAGHGGIVVGEVVATMNRISASSRKIGDIISVIDGIAFQTNILALNAAVEAARAGEQGRGFAVVASEVRSLAQRSANAAKEIKVLINESVETVESGARLVGDAGRSMEDIVAQVKQVSTLIQEIDTASHEQTTGIGQVNVAVTQLDQVTQQNAALVEQAAAAAENLKTQADGLVNAVGIFRLAA